MASTEAMAVSSAKKAELGIRNYLAVGFAGGGKTSLFCTIPGRKFMHVFDPNTLKTIRGQDIDYVEFKPDLLPMDIISLEGRISSKQISQITDKPVVWEEFSEFFEESFRSGFYDKYDVIGFDGATMLQAAGLQQIAYTNGRYGKWPQEDDYAPVMQAIENSFINITQMRKSIFLSAHLEDKDTRERGSRNSTSFTRLVLLGRLRTRIPMLFSEILVCSCQSMKEEKSNEVSELFEVQTRPNDAYKTVRCTIRGLGFYEDVTIRDWSRPEKYGIGNLLKKEKEYAINSSPRK